MGRRQFSLIAAGIAILLFSVSACSYGDVARNHDAPQRDILRRGDEYVAMGDSYTVAPRTGPVTAKDGCARSAINYPHQVAKELGLELTDVSCGGASTQHVTEPQLFLGIRHPPQVAAVSSTTDLVTVSLGGNDFNVFAAVVHYCTAIGRTNPAGSPCSTADTANGKSVVEQRIALIETRLIEAIRAVTERAPKSRVVVVGYPQFFPVAGPCAQLPLAAGDFRYARRVNELLVQAQRQAAAKAGVDYVDVFAATKGHDMCADEPWIAGGTPTRSDALSYHPYPEEQRAVAELLVDLLD